MLPSDSLGNRDAELSAGAAVVRDLLGMKVRFLPTAGPGGTATFLIEDNAVGVLRYVALFIDDQIDRFTRNWYASREAVESRAAQGACDLMEAIRSDKGFGSI